MTPVHWSDCLDRASARRAAARMHHPDHGGDARAFADALAAIDRRFGADSAFPAGSADVAFRTSTRGAAQARLTTIRVRYRRLRGRVPLRRRGYFTL